jgi:hypothetical protein
MDAEGCGFKFHISSVEETEMDSGDDAYILYLAITNSAPNPRAITMSKATYVSAVGEQLSQDIWLTGLLIGSETILAKAHRKCGLVFYKKHLEEMCVGDSLHCRAEIPHCAKTIALRFDCMSADLASKKGWVLAATEIEDAPLSESLLADRLLGRVERLEAFEERLGVRLEGLSIRLSAESNQLTLLGEIYSRNGARLSQNTAVRVTVYDADGRVLDVDGTSFPMDDFHVFSSFEVWINHLDVSKIARLRVYPEAS